MLKIYKYKMCNLITIKTSDDHLFIVDAIMYKKSRIIADMLDLDEKGQLYMTEDRFIPLININSKIFELINRYVIYHQNDMIQDKLSINIDINLSDWDNDFLCLDPKTTLSKLMIAANYMEIDGLFKACVKKITYLIRDKNPEEIRLMLGIQNNLTLEQELKIKTNMKIFL